MITLWYKRFRQWRRRLSRSEWLVRLLGLARIHEEEPLPGLVMIQIDGLSRRQLERAMERGDAPFLRRLQRLEDYELVSFYSGMPSSTPAVQGEIFYGVKGVVPSWGFHMGESSSAVTMFRYEAASAVQAELEKNPGLLSDGSAYADIYSGGAQEAHFCAARMGWGDILEEMNPLRIVIAVVLNFVVLLRILALAVVELVVAIVDFVHGVLNRYEFKEELLNIPARVGVGVIMREIITRGAMLDVARGVPVIHLNYLGYDEQAHRRGPSSALAHWSLKGIDDCIKRLWRAAQRSRERQYQVWIYSDHGQEETTPYFNENGRSIQEAVAAVFDRKWEEDRSRRHDHGAQLERARWLGGRRTQRIMRNAPTAPSDNEELVVAKGPTGHVYAPDKLSGAEETRIARALVREANVPLVLAKAGPGRAKAWTAEGVFQLPEDAEKVLGEDHPFLSAVTEDLIRVVHHPWSGSFLISGWRPQGKPLTFPLENGSHAGPGREETHGFALVPRHVSIARPAKGYIRPLELRAAAMRLRRFGAHCPVEPEEVSPMQTHTGLRLMTYNVHGCVGMDGRLDIHRLAEVIQQYDPDVVALQELDVHRSRSGGIHQAEALAHALEMDFHFHPALRVADEQYGDAILSRIPMRLIKGGSLPTPNRCETRGALWVELDVDGTKVQLINSHFGLGRRERMEQAQALLGPSWLGHPDCRAPRILCGDFNSMPRSAVYRALSSVLRDTRTCPVGLRRKFAGTFLGLWHLDYIFVSEEFEVDESLVPCHALARIASDHLPVVVHLRLKAPRPDATEVLPPAYCEGGGNGSLRVSGEALSALQREDRGPEEK